MLIWQMESATYREYVPGPIPSVHSSLSPAQADPISRVPRINPQTPRRYFHPGFPPKSAAIFNRAQHNGAIAEGGGYHNGAGGLLLSYGVELVQPSLRM